LVDESGVVDIMSRDSATSPAGLNSQAAARQGAAAKTAALLAAMTAAFVLALKTTTFGCPTIPGTNTPVGAACFPKSAYPTLNNPQNPVNYGADKTGVNDSTAAINAALAVGDAYFSTPGFYLVALDHLYYSIVPPPGRTIECVPGVTLIAAMTSDPCGGNDCGILSLLKGGNTVVGCDFQGGNWVPGPVDISSNQVPELIEISSNNDTVEGNTFENTWGNTAVQVNSSYTGILPSNYLIQYNTFSHNAYYGPEVSEATWGIIQNNLVIDGAIGMEDSACPSSGVGRALIQNNELMVSVGDCAVTGQQGCYWAAFITGGMYPPGCDYSGVMVTGNYCQGSSTQLAQIANYDPGGAGSPASYSGNHLGPNCSCATGSGC
jgi:hypothetical protein